MSKRAVSVIDVAQVSGVSTATVSRTLSQPEKVSERTRTKVMQAVQQKAQTASPATPP